MLNKNYLAEFITTFVYIGKIKYCPGTFGSLVAFPLSYLIAHCSFINQVFFPFGDLSIAEQKILGLLLILALACLLLFIIGVYYASVYVKTVGRQDPREVVIDEVVGQMIVITLVFFSNTLAHYSRLLEYLSPKTIDFIFLFILPFGLFRFFDIIKPWPINWIDQNIKGGVGVMLDDVLAAVFASVAQYAITFLIIDWFGQ